jgi:transcriptional regulator with XRE-family HTH domain
MAWIHVTYQPRSQAAWERLTGRGLAYTDDRERRWVWVEDRPHVQPGAQMLGEMRRLGEVVEALNQAVHKLSGAKLSQPAKAATPAPAEVAEVIEFEPAGAWHEDLVRLIEYMGSATAAARALGVGQPTASRWLAGKRVPQPQFQQRIAELAAGLSLDVPVRRAA